MNFHWEFLNSFVILQNNSKEALKILNPIFYFLKILKIFKIEGALFLDVIEVLEKTLQILTNILDIKDFSFVINDIIGFVEELVNSYLEQSYGNKIFTKLIYFFTIPHFDNKIRK